MPDVGNLLKREWFGQYVTLSDRSQGRIVKSLYTAQKTEPSNDYTVLTPSYGWATSITLSTSRGNVGTIRRFAPRLSDIGSRIVRNGC